ncbi:hypothetical protein KY363_01695 [Candidatus Woesearchaeota archaeon]|nr:hypothetical protein [Candidatus Woesearchaeota archaeon]
MKVRYLAIVVAIALLLVLVGCGKKAAPAPAAPAPAPAATAPAPTAPAEETSTTETTETTETSEEEGVVVDTGEDVTETADEEKSAKGLAVDLKTGDGAFEAASCALKEVDGKEKRVISVTIMNVESDTWEIYGKANPKGKVRIGNRGVIQIEAGCEVMTLEAGESTTCDNIANGVIAGENRITVNTPVAQLARVVECP